MTATRSTWSLVLLIFIAIAYIPGTSAKYHHIKLRHGRHRRQHGGSYIPSSFVLDTDEPERGNWGPWSSPSSCSRSCGGGVAHQTRQCLDIDDSGFDRCTGAARRFFSCNIQACPGEAKDFRAEQCAEYNSVPFEGVYYDWIPYTGGPNKCELNCMPRGERFFYRHRTSVTDGTPCEIEKNDVCVEGKCMHVGCDMMLGSEAREDACRECGGNGSDCNTVNGLFDTTDLQGGYIDILLIPEGATNIVVKEIKASNNYLAVRNTSGHYYLNGNWMIDFPRSLRFAGTIFHYSRDPQGFAAPDTITALGPTTEPIYIVLLYQDHNVGVHYEYSIPKKLSPTHDPDSYTWITDEFSTCSVSCGGGYQSRRVACVRRRDNQPVDEGLCDPQLEPADTQSCNEQACPPEWVEGEWSDCSKQCGGGEQTREIKCEQIVSGGIPTVVDDSQCLERLGPKAATTQECNKELDCPMWHLGPWKPCDHLCGEGKQIRKVTCYKKVDGKIQVLDDSACESEAPEREKPCELRPCEGLDWVTSEWSGCGDKCGLTQETRTVQCMTQDGHVYPDDKCDVEKKPELTRECENPKNCEFQWYAGQWSECSAKCGSGLQTRMVFCGTFDDENTLKKVEESKCDAEKKFEDSQNCTVEEECKGEWFAGPWSKCSKPCGGGDMTRKLICMKDNMTVPISNCNVETIMFARENCNEHSCGPDEVTPVEPGKEQAIKEDETEGDEECEEYEDEGFVSVTTSLDMDKTKSDAAGLKDVTPLSSPFVSDGTATMGEDTEMMFSDSAYTRGDIVPTDFSSSYSSGYGSGDEDYTNFDSTYYTPESEGSSIFEGSGASTDESSSFETTVSGETEVTTSSDSGRSESGSTEFISSTVSGITESSEASSIFDTAESGDTSLDVELTTISESSEGTTESSSATESTVSGSTDETTTSSDLTTDSTYFSGTDLSTTSSGTDLTTESEESTTSSSTEFTDTTGSTDSTVTEMTQTTEPTETTESTESTSPTETTPTEETESTTTEESSSTAESSTSESTDSSEYTSTTELTTTPETSSGTTGTLIDVKGEYEATEEEETGTQLPDVSGSTDVTTESGSTMETTTEISETTETSTTEVSTMTETTESGQTTESSETTVSGTTESGMTTESAETETAITTTEISETSESAETTESGATTESGLTTSSEESTVSGETTETELSTLSGETTETTESGMTTESAATTESGETTISAETTESGMTTETTEVGMTSETAVTEEETDLSEKTYITDFWTTIAGETSKTTRKCKIRRKKSCKKTEFGCCYDGITAAEGPFGKGCPTPLTCNETKYGCCPDGVSPATGRNNEGCPESHCNETLFGCCPDGITAAEGNDFEGCKKPCNETEFGCCPDKETPASGKDNLGCCNVTKFGCCPDGIKPATGPEGEGCEEETTSYIPVTDYETTTVPAEQDCANSTYGCCPDGVKPATGINFEGCGVIDQENCTASYFGCCPDETTAALGPDNYGCSMLCTNTTYGCCPDGSTPSHGPNGEGCCLSGPYGCCPDNILPARGPDYYGCGCQYTRFGCCPDNSTAARGPNNEGCGCQYTSHGCCPNRFTPATGPNYKGCPCYTYQFGCCPDGVTIARGPHGQGCGCENTEFKCCSDGRTPAKGPNFAGCTCDASKYGCCADGIEEAQGENFEGCLSVPPMPGAACSLERDRGPCRNFTVKWFFDTEYAGCSRFWYGGCEGNENRFKTQEECKEVCVEPKGKAACFLPKISGPCKGYYPTWYYDSARKQCGQFIYGGCLGNANKFATREECEGLCMEPEDVDPCDQSKESGPCQGNFTRWYFNKEAQTCEQFNYGGCKANNNNFPTEIACHQQCLQPGRSRVTPLNAVCALEKDPGPCPGSLLRWHYDASRHACVEFVYGGCKGNGNKFRSRALCELHCPSQGIAPKTKHSCSLPRDEGSCSEKHSRWYFDQSENRCMPFYYTGCGGNKNNFDSKEACESDCPPKIEQDICLLPALLGECHNYTQRWYYDSYEQRCRQFYYGGCGGNENNFRTDQECISRCETVVATPPPKEKEFRLEHCFLPDAHGPCPDNQVKWFYDSREGICKQFMYGGCQSNGNKFDSREECEYRCGEVQDACTLPKVIGPCDGFVKQYYYDRRTDTCQEFDYSGCQGNKNRFQDRESCERKCRRHEPAPVQTSPPPTTPPPPTEIVPSSPICSAAPVAGPCSADITAYYYDAHSRVCQAFIYSGCGGNANRFQTEEQCERLCGRFQGQDMCNLPVDSGPCRGAFPKFYYDPSIRGCREFTYGGCDGNANRFSTASECESICIHHEEPAPGGNDTALSHLEICREPVDIGSCSSGNYKRFYYDDERQTCIAFIYTGCGGNRNRFKTFESCINTCYRTSNEIDVGGGSGPQKDLCDEAREECNIIRCPYGKEYFVDSQDCERCRCVDPCRKKVCPGGTTCAITLVATADGTEYRAVCRSTVKPGICPSVSNSTRCEQECITDADCAEARKCCSNGCGTSCLEPAPEELITTLPPPVVYPVTPLYGAAPAAIQQPEEPHVAAAEGGFVTLTCIATGNPIPVITWRKDTTLITNSEQRRRILNNGSLQIINLYSSDSGTYICTADNGLGSPVRTEYQLEVTEPRELPAGIVGEPDTQVTVTMNSPAMLHCYAMGWPRPFVTWWRGDRMLPLSSEIYEQDSDYTLLIHTVTLTTLGVYTCQAYNGIDRPASWSVTLQAIGPVYNIKPEHQQYTQYLVLPPKRPTSDKPQYPYRPTRTQSPVSQTYAPVYPSRPHRPPPPSVIPLTSTSAPGSRFTVPLNVSVSVPQEQFPEGSDVNIACNVDGFPIPRVQWYKDDMPIQISNRITISEANRLIISDANKEDSGRYRCEASNGHTSASDSVDIRVAGIFIHPNCQDNSFFAKCDLIVIAKYCQHKYYAKFCCRSCTEAGQLPSRGPHLENTRRRRSALKNLF